MQMSLLDLKRTWAAATWQEAAQSTDLQHDQVKWWVDHSTPRVDSLWILLQVTPLFGLVMIIVVSPT